MADIDRQTLAAEALGAVLLRGGPHGDCVIVLDRDSVVDAARAWPSAMVFTPIEISALAAYRGDAASLAQVCRFKRLTGGMVTEVRVLQEAIAA